MSRTRDQRVLPGLIRKAQDPGIPAAERHAFRAKAEEIHRRLTARGMAQEADSQHASSKSAPSEPRSDTAVPPKPQKRRRRTRRKARAWRPAYGVLACVVGLGLGLFVQSQPGAAMIVLGLTTAFGAVCAIWLRRTASEKSKAAPATG